MKGIIVSLFLPLGSAYAQTIRTNSEFTKNQIPVEVGACSEPGYYRDTLERNRVKMHFVVKYCKEKVVFQERAAGSEGNWPFKRTRWARVAGTEKITHEYASETKIFDLSFEGDSFRGETAILRDLKDACENSREELSARALRERANVRCR